MTPSSHYPATIDHHIADLPIAPSEQPTIENRVSTGRRQIGIVAIQHQPVRALSHLERANRLPQGLRPATKRRIVQGSPNHWLIAAMQPITSLITQTLAIFQPTQFFDHAQ